MSTMEGTARNDASTEEPSKEEPSRHPEVSDFRDEVGERSGAETTGQWHGAEDLRSFRLEHSEQYLEPMSRARSIEPFQNPRSNVERINPDFEPDGAGGPYNMNCADCPRCYEATWRGQEQEAAGRAYQIGESGGLECTGEPPEMIEEWAHEKFEPTSPAELRQAIEQAGHGASAIVGTEWRGLDPGGHAYNVVNYHGEILTVDAQEHQVYPYSDKEIHPLFEGHKVSHEAMAWDAAGRRIL